MTATLSEIIREQLASGIFWTKVLSIIINVFALLDLAERILNYVPGAIIHGMITAYENTILPVGRAASNLVYYFFYFIYIDLPRIPPDIMVVYMIFAGSLGRTFIEVRSQTSTQERVSPRFHIQEFFVEREKSILDYKKRIAFNPRISSQLRNLTGEFVSFHLSESLRFVRSLDRVFGDLCERFIAPFIWGLYWPFAPFLIVAAHLSGFEKRQRSRHEERIAEARKGLDEVDYQIKKLRKRRASKNFPADQILSLEEAITDLLWKRIRREWELSRLQSAPGSIVFIAIRIWGKELGWILLILLALLLLGGDYEPMFAT